MRRERPVYDKYIRSEKIPHSQGTSQIWKTPIVKISLITLISFTRLCQKPVWCVMKLMHLIGRELGCKIGTAGYSDKTPRSSAMIADTHVCYSHPCK